jgi:hypothetical protein
MDAGVYHKPVIDALVDPVGPASADDRVRRDSVIGKAAGQVPLATWLDGSPQLSGMPGLRGIAAVRMSVA